MVELLKGIDRFFEFLGPITDMLWEFPRNFDWYANIPLIGELSLAIWVLVGGGLYFSIKLGFVQVR